MTPTSHPRREGPVISEERERHLVAANMPFHRFPAARRCR